MLRKGKGKEAKLVFMAHALMENRHGMLVDFQTTQATGTAERDIVPELLGQARERGFHPKTLGGAFYSLSISLCCAFGFLSGNVAVVGSCKLLGAVEECVGG